MSADIMRLVINRRNCNANAGLNRYNGRGIYQNIGRKVLLSGLRKVKKDEAEIADLDEKIEGKGIDVVDSSNSDESTKVDSDEKSSIETTSNSSNETAADEDKESIVDEKSAHNDEESIQNDEESNEKSDEETEASGVKRKYSPSVIDFLINNNTEDSSTPTKLQCLDSSMSYCHDENDTSTKSDVDDFDTHLNTLLNEKKNHSLIKIPPTKKKRYPQKICIHCRRNLGVRNDTRYICTLCDVALCKQPCFAEYHCNK